jgi:cobalt-zinc-cadmium efflux system protein
MAAAAALIGSFTVVEVIGGLVAGSLALLADAGHMLTDFGALALAWLAFRVARWPADRRRTYGFDRFEILVAFGNGLALFAIAAWIVVEAAGRLAQPRPVEGGLMFVVAGAGLAVNIVTFLVLHGADQRNLNVRGAALHVIGDTLGSVAALLAAVVIMTTGWTPIDPILSVVVALIILRAAWRIVRESGHILLEGTPPDLDPRAIARTLVADVDGLRDVHHVHLWSITQERTMTTLHAVIDPGSDPERVIEAVKRRLAETFGLDHVTVEIETERCKDEVA